MQVSQKMGVKPFTASRKAVRVYAATLEKPVQGLSAADGAAPASGQFLMQEKNVTRTIPSMIRPGIDDGTIRAKMEAMIRKTQTDVCAAIEEVDGRGKFRTDAWMRNGGGGGISKVMQGGDVWEKAGVAVSVVYGNMTADALKAANPDAKLPSDPKAKVPFFVASISSVMHPWNPHCPTMHFNYRYFETFDAPGVPGQWWFGGGTDITPMYLVPEDLAHFHNTYKRVCDRHDPTYYKRMKAWCDEYFTIKHRGEIRGMGGIFYDGLNDKSQEAIFAFSKDCAENIAASYCPIVQKHKNDKYSPEEKRWQQIRRGRYVEYNLIYDRGTIFGLQTGGRVESILMSMPLTARWEYGHEPEAGTREADFLDAARRPRDWATC